jgi:O-antigen/teichoic acid export membrane protein
MRTKKTTKNIIISIFYEILVVITAFLLPRLVLVSFGSSVNGVTQTINQFIGYISLLSSGVGAVTMAALYKPLADNDNERFSAIVNATKKFLRKISRLFILALFFLAMILPVFLLDEFDFGFIFLLVIFLGFGTFSNYYFGLTYKTILNADQKQYINIIVQMITLTLHTLSSVILINTGNSILIVKFVSAIIFSINPILIYFYVTKKYKINKTISPDFTAIEQRWDAFAHQAANLINNNTDLILLLIFVNSIEASVFAVYYLVYNGILTLIASMITGVQSAFGNMIAKNEVKLLGRALEIFELFLHSISVVIFVAMFTLIIPFVNLYTHGLTDANYTRPLFSAIISVTGFLVAIRVPYQILSRAAGHYRETRKGALVEAIINIAISLLLVVPFGIVGLAIGTCIATIYRTLDFGIYISKHIIYRKLIFIIKRFLVSSLNIIVILFILSFLSPLEYNDWFEWLLNAMIITGISILITFIINIMIYNKDSLEIFKIFKRVFKLSKLR